MYTFTCKVRHKGHPADDRSIRDVIEMLVLETKTPFPNYNVTFGPIQLDYISYYQEIFLTGLSSEADPQRDTVWAA